MATHLDFHKRDAEAAEILDGPGLLASQVRDSVGDLDRLGAALGWTWLAVRDAADFASRQGLERLRVLDIGTGAGNVPLALARWSRRSGVELALVALDINEAMLTVARASCSGYPEIEFVLGDALALPFADRSFDLVLCQGTFHHFAPEAAVVLLAEAARVTDRRLLVTDLRRSPLLYAAAWILLHLVVKTSITRHDGLSSIRRAYVPAEMLRLAHTAGLSGARLGLTLHFRQRLEWERP